MFPGLLPMSMPYGVPIVAMVPIGMVRPVVTAPLLSQLSLADTQKARLPAFV
jgi:hypothetical protein